jgi:hypothetical protein
VRVQYVCVAILDLLPHVWKVFLRADNTKCREEVFERIVLLSRNLSRTNANC